MKKINLALLLGAAVGLALAACGDIGSGDGGTGGCTSDATCATGQGCHPLLKMCMDKCTTATDCSASQNTCDVINASASKFCQCGSDTACAAATAGNVCMATTKTCSKACTATTGCASGQTCDLPTGQCKNGATDAGPAADAGVACTYGSCGATGMCDLTTHTCKSVACNINNQQPDTCKYPSSCASDNQCYDVEAPAATCTNFNNYTGASFNPEGAQAPVIYWIEALSGDDNVVAGVGFCDPANTFTANVHAYNPNSTFPATGQGAQLSGFNYVMPDGTSCDAKTCGGAGIFRKVSGFKSSADGKDATIKISLCAATTVQSVMGAFYFTGGNHACASIPN